MTMQRKEDDAEMNKTKKAMDKNLSKDVTCEDIKMKGELWFEHVDYKLQ